MTSVGPGGSTPADDRATTARRLSPPPPQYDASDEISLDDPAPVDGGTDETEPSARPTLRGSGPEPVTRPTPPDVRVGRPFRMFWLWFAPNSSVTGLVVGAALFSLGMSVRQVATSVLVGVMITAALLAVGVLRGRSSGLVGELDWSGVFGPLGARIVSAIGLAVRVGWGSLLLWGFASLVSGPGGLSITSAVILVVGALVAGAAAVLGYRVIALSAAVTCIASALLITSLVAVDAERVDVPIALGIGDGPVESVLGGVVIVFSITALTVLPASTSIGRYQGVGPAPAHALSAALGLIVPVIVLAIAGALLAGSDPDLAARMLSSPVSGLARLAPPWAELPLTCLAGLGLLMAAALTVYSGGFALQAAGLRLGRGAATSAVAVITSVVAILFAVDSPDGRTVLIDVVTTVALPVAAISGVVTTRAILTRFRGPSRPVSDAPLIRWRELAVLAIAIAIGFGLTTATAEWLSWQGYLLPSGAGAIAASDPGVLAALLVGGLVGFTDGPPRRRRPGRGTHRGDRMPLSD